MAAISGSRTRFELILGLLLCEHNAPALTKEVDWSIFKSGSHFNAVTLSTGRDSGHQKAYNCFLHSALVTLVGITAKV